MSYIKVFRSIITICILGKLSIFAMEIPTQDLSQSIEDPFSLSSAKDEASHATQELIFRLINNRISSQGQKKNFLYFADGGGCTFKGEREQFVPFIDAFSAQLESVFNHGVVEDEFITNQINLLAELESLGATREMEIVESLTFQDVTNWLCDKENFMHAFGSFIQRISEEELSIYNQEEDSEIGGLLFTRRELHDNHSIDLTLINNTPDYSLFFNLRLLEEDKKNISSLIKNLADKSYYDLLKMKKAMVHLGRKIDPVHPLRFIGYIMSDHSLKRRVKHIQNDWLLSHEFIKGFGNRMSHEANRGNLLPYVPGLCQLTKSSPSIVEHYIHSHDWKGLVEYLTSS